MGVTRREFAAAAAATPLIAGAAPDARPELGDFGLDLAGFDRSVAPGDDFYRHANGTWLATNTIPADRATWSGGARLSEITAARVRKIVETAAEAGTADGRKVADYYATLMDEAGLERRGIEPLRSDLTRIAAVNDAAALARELAGLSWVVLPNPGSTFTSQAPIDSGYTIDRREPTRYHAGFSQGGLGLPNRDFYVVDTAPNLAIRSAYRAHLAKMLTMAGLDDAEARAARVYALEERLARGHRSREANADIDKRYNLWRRADFAANAPGLDWDAHLDAAGMASESVYVVAQPEAIAAAAAAARDVPLAHWRDYLAFRAVRNFAPVGPLAFQTEDFDFNSRVLLGTPQMPERWKRAVQQTERAMGPAIGEIYLQRHFPAAHQAEIRRLTANLKLAMARRLKGLAWMSPQTKARALAKVDYLRIEVGGQRPPRSYASLTVTPGDAYGNLLRAQSYERARNLARRGQPVDRSEWSMNPQTVNASANQSLVTVMFPAANLQAPNFDPNADAAVNYGAIGSVIGHEITHHFDDQGAKFDARGRLNNWWEPQDLARFRAASAALAAQYDAYEPLPGLHINGRLTLGENIADLAGLAIAHDAYRASLGGRPAPVLGGLSGDQRFFLSYAQTNRYLQRESRLRQMLVIDAHAPAEWRTAEVRNLDAWYTAFDVKPGQRMYLAPEARVRVW